MPTAAYIGPAARLVPIQYVTGTKVESGGRYSVQTAATRAWAFVANKADNPPARTWHLDVVADNASMASLQELAMGAFGDGPFYFVPESAYVTNALTPQQASIVGPAGSGVEVVDGFSARAALGPANANLATGVPVLPGGPCTISVDAAGGATLQAVFRNAAGAAVRTSTKASTGVLMQRLSISTSAAPTTARTVDVTVGGHTAAARPQVTWLNYATPWAPGAGARSVIVEDFEATTINFDASGDLFQRASVTIREVG